MIISNLYSKLLFWLLGGEQLGWKGYSSINTKKKGSCCRNPGWWWGAQNGVGAVKMGISEWIEVLDWFGNDWNVRCCRRRLSTWAIEWMEKPHSQVAQIRGRADLKWGRWQFGSLLNPRQDARETSKWEFHIVKQQFPPGTRRMSEGWKF